MDNSIERIIASIPEGHTISFRREGYNQAAITLKDDGRGKEMTQILPLDHLNASKIIPCIIFMEEKLK